MGKVHEGQDIHTYPCTVCDYKSIFPSYVELHMKIHDPLAQIDCQHCNLSLKNTESLRKHIKEFHSTRNTYINCEVCGRAFQSINRLKYHKKRAHENSNSFNCSKCKFSANCHYKLQQHRISKHAVWYLPKYLKLYLQINTRGTKCKPGCHLKNKTMSTHAKDGAS